MRPSCALCALPLIAAFAGATFAADHTPTVHYRWHDAQGGLHYSDSVPPDAVHLGYDVINDQGMVIQHINRALTPAERAAAAQQAAVVAAAKRTAEAQARADQQMLAAYPTEAELVEAQQAKLAENKQQVQTAQLNLHNQEQGLADLLTHAAELERSGKPVPAPLRQRIADQRANVATQRNALDTLQRQSRRAVQDNATQLQRYRVLRAKLQGNLSD